MASHCLFLYFGLGDDILRFFVLLESILVYAKICRDPQIKIIAGIHPRSIYKKRITSSHLWNSNIQLIELDSPEVSSVYKSSVDKSSVDFSSFTRILSLHINCVVVADLKPLFHLDSVLMEGNVIRKEAWSGFIHEFTPSTDVKEIMHFFDVKKDETILQHVYSTVNFIHQYLMPVVRMIGEPLEGNIFMGGHSEFCTNIFENKTKNICYLMLHESVSNVMEIGFNAGFSSLLMLIANPHIKLQCYDLGEHKYTVPCYQVIKEFFGDRINLVLGDSMQTVKHDSSKYDVIHIDGGHDTTVAESDILQSYRLSLPGTLLIMDDYNFGHLHQLWDEYVARLGLIPVDIRLYPSPHHDIKAV